MTSEKGCRKDKNQNIQVFVRLRPLNQRERDIKSLGVIEVLHNREVVVRQSQQTAYTKKFTFDRAFGPNAKQVEVYQEVVSPLIEEVLAGYNCTVFAYGQTGTGKTHTMVGENSGDETNWQSDPLAGIIPRALSQLFDELRISNTEYTVRVSYLELYNEELFDLLSSSEDNSKLRIYEDVTRKGSNIVNGLEEITVYNKNEVYKIMAQGQERKRVASTLMNAQSSRSHTVFTIVVHMKENSPEGEELVKIGKLNLVDLAGSENISKAGSDNPAKKERARECVNINQSLLTLGRVITALVERHPHIPYRESKLTRILQESLGGRTKTSIIATISPGHKDIEETMSTLEYANRAKNIQNKPEVNQKMTKKAILKEYAEEIDRLKRDLQAARDKNGVYLANETFTELTLKQEEQRKEIQELLLKKRAMEEEKDKMENVFSDLNKTLEKRISELNATRNKLSNTKTQLANTNNMLRSTKLQFEEQAHIVEKQKATESVLSAQARELLAAADVATHHVQCLHESVDKRRRLESTNLQITGTYREQSAQHRANITAGARHFTEGLVEDLNGLHNTFENFTATNTKSLQDSNSKIGELVRKIGDTMNEIKSLSSHSQSKLVEATDSHRALVKSAVDSHHCAVQTALDALLQSVASCVHSAENQDVAGSVAKFVEHWYVGAVARVSSLQRSHASFTSSVAATEDKRGDMWRAQHDARRAAAERLAADASAAIAEIEEEKAQIEKRLTQQLSDIETERQHTEDRLQRWLEHETRRLRTHVQAETQAMEERLAKKAKDVENEREYLEARITRHVARHRALLHAHEEELARAARHREEAEDAAREARGCRDRYGDEFDEGATAIGADLETFSGNVVQVVQELYSELLRTLLRAREQVESETRAAAAQGAAAGEQLQETSDAALARLLLEHQATVDTVLTHIENNNTTTIDTLTALSATTTELIATAHCQASSHGAAVRGLTGRVASFEGQLREATTRHEELEGRYLSEEYKVYSPTGATPSRVQYRYPRALAATSPHERVLARLRARRHHADDDDCLVVESDPESRATSDCDSSLSEDSVLFAAPSPPLPPTPPAPTPNFNGNHRGKGILKCTSESDIFNIQRNQEHQTNGKENADRSITYKKASKLRAPASHKKPLVERNGN